MSDRESKWIDFVQFADTGVMPDPTTREEREEARKIVSASMRPQKVNVAQYLDTSAVQENIARALAARRPPLTEADVESVLRALIDCHEDRCDGRPGEPCPWPKKARAVLARLGGGK